MQVSKNTLIIAILFLTKVPGHLHICQFMNKFPSLNHVTKLQRALSKTCQRRKEIEMNNLYI